MNMIIAQSTLSSAVEDLWTGIVDAIPRVASALVVVAVGVLVARGVRALVRRRLAKDRSESFARVFSRVTGFAVTILAIVFAATIAFPSVKPVDILAGLGILSVAIGFAFKDILENLLAGILLVYRQPFQIGDQVEVGGERGRVADITIRETHIDTFAGRRIIIPNASVYTGTIEVQTFHDAVRTAVAVGVSYDADLDEARTVIVDAMKNTDGVAADPEPQALLTDFGSSSMNFEARFWTEPQQATIRRVQDGAITAVKKSLDDAGIDIPYDIVVLEGGREIAEALKS